MISLDKFKARFPELKLKEANLPGCLTFETPPADFDLLNASSEELHSYGLPHRPDPKVSLEAARTWRRVMARKKRFYEPKLSARKKRHKITPLKRQKSELLNTEIGGYTWSGLVVNQGGPFFKVWGTFNVPNFAISNVRSGEYGYSIWVGFDGYDTTDLLQAGVNMIMFADNPAFPPQYYAWIQWWGGADGDLQVNQNIDFSCSPGDTIAVYLVYDDSQPETNQAIVQFANLVSGNFTTPLIFSTAKTNAIPGDAVEWIVEDPEVSIFGGPGTPVNLPDFGAVNFTNAEATSSSPNGYSYLFITSDGQGQQLMEDTGAPPYIVEQVTPAIQVVFTQTEVILPKS